MMGHARHSLAYDGSESGAPVSTPSSYFSALFALSLSVRYFSSKAS